MLCYCFSCTHNVAAACRLHRNSSEKSAASYSNSYFKLFSTGGLSNTLLQKEYENAYNRELAKNFVGCDILESFCLMNKIGTKPTKYLLCTTLNACAKLRKFFLGQKIHAHIIKVGYEHNMFLNSALLDLYAKCDSINDAIGIFYSMKKHDEVSWTSIISGFSQSGHGLQAILMFKLMICTQFKPNEFTYVSVISASIGLKGALTLGLLFHSHVVKLGFNSNNFVISSLVDCYSKCGRIKEAAMVFHETKEMDNVMLNSMIVGYAQNFCSEEAIRLFTEMMNMHLNPTDHTLSIILNACGSLAVLHQGRQIHSLVIKMGSKSNVFVVSALIDMYSKCGSIDEARCVFDKTVQKNSVSCTSMIMGYAQSGRGLDALALFEQLVTEEWFVTDNICFTSILTACSHAGFLERGIKYFNKMKEEYRLVPKLDQYACLVDLYARNGHLKKAKELMRAMPCNPNYVMWSSFLSSCKVHGDVELGTDAANKLIEMEPWNAAPYVMLAHIYARAGLQAEVAQVRKLMQKNAIRKEAACSWIELEKSVYVFSVGDSTQLLSQEIYEELERLNMEMKEIGICPKE